MYSIRVFLFQILKSLAIQLSLPHGKKENRQNRIRKRKNP